MRKFGPLIGLVTLLPVLLAALPSADAEPQSAIYSGACGEDRSFEAHDPIVLAGDHAAIMSAALGTNGVRSGAGTADDPLIISDWAVEAEGAVAAIHISRVSLHLIIEDMTITGSGESPAIVIEDSTNVTLNSFHVRGDVHLTDSTIDATSLQLVGGRLRTFGGTIHLADTYVHSATEDGEITWTFIASTFDVTVTHADDCADADRAYFGINVLGTTPHLVNRLILENVDNTIVTVTKTAQSDLHLDLNTAIYGVQATGAVMIRGQGGPAGARNASVEGYTAQGDGATATIASARLGSVSFLDADHFSLRATDSILNPRSFDVHAAAVLDIHCDRSDVRLPDRIGFHLAIAAADCFVDDPSGKAIITPAEGRRAQPHFDELGAATEQNTPHPSIIGLLVLVFIMASTSRRKGRRGRVSIQP